MLREFFSGISLTVEDLLLLESFQIKYLPERVPQDEFSVLIQKYPFISQFLILKEPTVEEFINSLLQENNMIRDEDLTKKKCDEVLWEIADLIVYNKYPEVYEEKAKFAWRIDEIIKKESLAGKVIVDVGAGSGTLAFMLAQYAETVFAIEPISSFRSFIRQKAFNTKCMNVYPLDGFLELIPFPADTFDLLFTSNAIGWNIDKELQEIERVVKPGGQAIHIMRVNEITENPVHEKLISGETGYKLSKNQDGNRLKLKYSKEIK
jgi:ubiquinone/menaquinone biosynthesis C-methylase UbiE